MTRTTFGISLCLAVTASLFPNLISLSFMQGTPLPYSDKLSPQPGINSIAAAFACPPGEIPKPSPKEKDLNLQAGLAFSHSAQFDKEFSSALDSAKAACQKHIGEENIAVVSDIDETLLDNRPAFDKLKKWDWNVFIPWIELAKDKTLPTAGFLRWARQNGFAVFLITGRSETQRRATIVNLVHDGIGYDGLYMRAANDHRLAEDMKTAYRKAIEAMGFRIIVNIGDQYSDLYGGHAADCEKLPNKIYYVP